ncbi:MAG: XTP/dITP diphosphatase [Promethearchaeota archaeon]
MKVEKSVLYFVTGNKNKFSEISQIFKMHQLPFKLQQLDIDPVEIQADSLEEVAIFKLNSIKGQIDSSFFVEDSGFFVDKPLKGFPGVYSSYVFKKIGNEGILKLIKDFQRTEAHFSTVIALYYKPLDKVLTFYGSVQGKISNKIRGSYGFGFDPIFISNDIPEKSFSELIREEKNKISHRGRAIRKLIEFLEKN